MIMSFTYFVYIGLTFFLVLGSFLTIRLKNTWNTYWLIGVFFPIVIISIVLGGRWNVGTDWDEYKLYYDEIRTFGLSWSELIQHNLEPLYLTLNKVVASLDLSSSYFFTFIAFLHFICFAMVYRNSYRVLPFGFYFFMLLFLTSMLNIQRQTLATCLFLLATSYIGKNLFKYTVCVTCAYLTHYSSIILFLFYFIGGKKFSFLDNRVLAFTLYFIAFIGAPFINQILLSIASIFITNEKYIRNMQELDINMEVSSGLGIIASHLLNLTILFYSKLLRNKAYLVSFDLSSLYRCFLVGCVFSNAFGLSMFLSRITFALTSLRIVLLSCLCYLLIQFRTSFIDKFVGLAITLLSFAMFIMSIRNAAGGISPFVFNWI